MKESNGKTGWDMLDNYPCLFSSIILLCIIIGITVLIYFVRKGHKVKLGPLEIDGENSDELDLRKNDVKLIMKGNEIDSTSSIEGINVIEGGLEMSRNKLSDGSSIKNITVGKRDNNGNLKTDNK